jgi:hypothetical protein
MDFILDLMWNKIVDKLYEHIDGLRSVVSSFNKLFKNIKDFLNRRNTLIYFENIDLTVS